jgi:hypothetical protein
MKTKYHKYFHWTVLGGLCICLNMNGQTATIQGYTKSTKHVMKLLNKNDFSNMNELDKLRLAVKTNVAKYDIQGTNENSPTGVKITITSSDFFGTAMQIPEYQYSTTKVTTKIGTKSTTAALPPYVQLKSFVPFSCNNLFNYSPTAMMDSLKKRNVSYQYATDGTLHFWIGNKHSFINKTTLTITRVQFDLIEGNTKTRIKYQKFTGNKVYPVLESNQKIIKLANNVKVLEEEEISTSYTGLAVMAGGKILDSGNTQYNDFAKNMSGQIQAAFYADENVAEHLDEIDCVNAEIKGVYNMYGQKLNDIKHSEDIKLLGLPAGIYKILKLCDNKIKTETIIISE